MPKFYKQNKKRIDPRYFLEETIDREDPPWGPSDPEHNVRTIPGAEHARATQLAHNAMNSMIEPDSDQDDALELLDMLISQIREGGKALYGRRNADGSIEDLMNMTIAELRDILWSQAHSQEQQDIDRQYRDEDDAAMGYDDEMSDLERMSKRRGFGRPRGIEEKRNAKKTKDDN